MATLSGSHFASLARAICGPSRAAANSPAARVARIEIFIFCSPRAWRRSIRAEIRDAHPENRLDHASFGGCVRCQCSAISRPVQNQTRSCLRRVFEELDQADRLGRTADQPVVQAMPLSWDARRLPRTSGRSSRSCTARIRRRCGNRDCRRSGCRLSRTTRESRVMLRPHFCQKGSSSPR